MRLSISTEYTRRKNMLRSVKLAASIMTAIACGLGLYSHAQEDALPEGISQTTRDNLARAETEVGSLICTRSDGETSTPFNAPLNPALRKAIVVGLQSGATRNCDGWNASPVPTPTSLLTPLAQ